MAPISSAILSAFGRLFFSAELRFRPLDSLLDDEEEEELERDWLFRIVQSKTKSYVNIL